MSNDPKKPANANETTAPKKLPKLDETAVEEIPAGDLDEVAGGMMPITDVKCEGCTGNQTKGGG